MLCQPCQPLPNRSIDELADSPLPLLIFGAATVGEVLFHLCGQHGFAVAGFCDNNAGLTGQRKCGVEIFHPQQLPARFPKARFILSTADIQDVVAQLRGLGYDQLFPGNLLLQTADLSTIPLTAPADFVEYAVTTCMMCHEAYTHPGRLFFRSVDLVITERCSLKCRDCSNLMQYYQKPRHLESATLLASIEKLCAQVEGINEFRVIGGEPFMHKEIDLFIDRLILEPKVRKIIIYTNGTIVPRPKSIPCLQNPKVLVLVTDYGPLSRHTDAVERFLVGNGIAFFRRLADNWTDCARIEAHGRSPELLRDVYRECCAKNLFTLMDGKLFRCPFSANADRLGAIPDFPGDSVDLLRQEGRETVGDDLRRLLFATDHLQACDFCQGRFLSDVQIAPAVQVSAPRPYTKAR